MYWDLPNFMQAYPSYGDLIDLLKETESDANTKESVANIFSRKFAASYPHISISRPSRFLDTVRRLAAPTKPSVVGQQKLMGSPLVSYRHRQWMPRTRNQPGNTSC